MRNQPASSSRRAALAKARRDPADSDATPQKTVVSIDRPGQPDSQKPRLVASDDSTRRLIFAIGRQRIAFDFSTRITHLAPGTGDAPAPVMSVTKRTKGNHNLNR